MSPVRLDLAGQKFGRWTAKEKLESKYNASRWLCVCECGTTKPLYTHTLRSEMSKSCGCLRLEQKRKNPYESLFNFAKNRAYRKSVVWGLSYEQFLGFVEQPCFYCGSAIHWHKYINARVTGSVGYHLDRKDPNGEYSADNCVPCCTLCNFTKANRFSFEEFKLVGEAIRKVLDGRSKT